MSDLEDQGIEPESLQARFFCFIFTIEDLIDPDCPMVTKKEFAALYTANNTWAALGADYEGPKMTDPSNYIDP